MSRVVVTGASSGIGRAVALLLAKSGHGLVLTARREGELRSLADACLVGGAFGVSVVPGDILEPDLAPQLADAAEMLGEGEIVLINGAGQAQFGEFHEMEAETSVAMVDSMLVGAMRTTHALLPLMLEEGRGVVINVLSIATKTTFPGAEAYSAAKYGLLGFSKSLSASYRSCGVRVTCLVPGAVDTPLWDKMDQHPDRAEMLSPLAVAETVKFVVESPSDRVFDEIVLTPPKGVL